MQNIRNTVNNYLTTRDEWLFFSLICALSLVQLTSNSWLEYGKHIANNSFYLLPILGFKITQRSLKAVLKQPLYQFGWIICFIVYPLLLFVWTNANSSYFEIDINQASFLLFCALGLELILFTSIKLTTLNLTGIAFKKIGLDELFLFFLSVVAVYAALLISSDLPLWYQSNSVQTVINFAEVLKQPWLTLWVAIQIFCLFFCGFIFYWLNHHVLIKIVLEKRGLLIYFCSVLSVLVILYPVLIELFLLLPINRMAEPIIPAVEADAFDWQNGRVFLAIMVVSLPIILVTQWHKKSSLLTVLEKENTQTELRFLKQQIDPHFLFNTLNNLYALCRKKSEQAPEVVMQLAQLMQFVVYRGQEPWVTMEEEVDYLNDYINLQSIRLNHNITIETTFDIDEPQTPIAPLLLIILIENAFKHGIEPTIGNGHLTLTLRVKHNELSFICENSITKDNILTTSDRKEGVGLSNLRRRLALIYPNKHQLTLDNNNTHFVANLKIDLTEGAVLARRE